MEVSNFSATCLKLRVSQRNSFNHVMLDAQDQTRLTRSCFDTSRMLRQVSRGVGANLLPASGNNLQTTRIKSVRQASKSRSSISCKITNQESGGSLSGESILQNEQTLEREMQIAIEEENYSQAAKLRDTLKLLQEDSKTSVLAANARFYNSFRKGDLSAMQSLWSKGEHVCVVHPGVSGISGYDLVMGSWEFVWADYEFPLEIEIKDVQVHVRGDVGYVTGIEMVKTKGSSWGRHFATNVFERVDGQWYMCIHHASYVDL